MTDQAHNLGAPFGSRSSAKRALIPVPDMMPSKRAAVPHAERAQNDGLCKGKLNRASADHAENTTTVAVNRRVTDNRFPIRLGKVCRPYVKWTAESTTSAGGIIFRHHTLTASTIDNGLSVAMTRDSRKPAPRRSL